VLSLLQDLPSEEVDQELIEDGQWEEILRQPCPSQYSAIKEEDVRPIFVLYALFSSLFPAIVKEIIFETTIELSQKAEKQ
jgi:hypothetical protein